MAKKKSKPEAKLSVQSAAEHALAHLHSVMPRAHDVSVEETEMTADGRYWLITLGYLVGLAFGPKEYKVFKVDARSGAVVSMRIREV